MKSNKNRFNMEFLVKRSIYTGNLEGEDWGKETALMILRNNPCIKPLSKVDVIVFIIPGDVVITSSFFIEFLTELENNNVKFESIIFEHDSSSDFKSKEILDQANIAIELIAGFKAEEK